MATNYHSIIIPLLSLLFLCSSSSNAKTFLNSINPQTETHPTNDIARFEVTKPINVPKTKPCQHFLLQQHNFTIEYGKRTFLVSNYTPPSPSHCPDSAEFSKIVLRWNGVASNVEYDTVFGVWLGGVELLRATTPMPRYGGETTEWGSEKDVTRYSSLLLDKIAQQFAVFFAPPVDSIFPDGVYRLNVTLLFYPAADEAEKSVGGTNSSRDVSKADLILPMSRNPPQNYGFWYEMQYSWDINPLVITRDFEIPRNAYRAVLEVYVSFHLHDTNWFMNYPDDVTYINDLGDEYQQGPFREVVVGLDGVTVGAVWPFTAIYSGGIDPTFWAPVSGIHAFNLPSYDVEMTPFLGKLLDGKGHRFEFSVTNGLNVSYVGANLHLWLDQKVPKTTAARLVANYHSPLGISKRLKFKGLNGVSAIRATRIFSSHGWVESSMGNITTFVNQNLSYSNLMNVHFAKDVKQVILSNERVLFAGLFDNYSTHSFVDSFKNFSFWGHFENEITDDGDFSLKSNLTLGLHEKNEETFGSKSTAARYLHNVQNAQGVWIFKDGRFDSETSAMQQSYEYNADNEYCYARNISSLNYDIISDKELAGGACN